ncbi:MAG: SDR family oxidoreductase [Verrucomicrobiales bacterium]|nr:SDR family oxidoreductase [Verrucomicrobiales bacterium]
MARLNGKCVIVTGSTTGIGAAIALRCVSEGAKVLLHGLETENGARMESELGGAAAFCPGDLTDTDVPQRLVDAALAAFGRLDAVVNNAAWVVRGRLEDTDAAFFDRVMQINVRAPFLLIRAAAAHLQKSKGCVVNIGSVNAYCGEENLLPYSISKGALMTLTRNLGDTLLRTHGIRVNQINPGWVLTENEKQVQKKAGKPDDWYKTLPAMFAPIGRIFHPEEIAEAAVYFLSDACGPISGQVLEVEQYPFIGRNPPK